MRSVMFALAVLALHVQPAVADDDAKRFLREVYLTYVEGEGDGVPMSGAGIRNVFTDSLADLIDADAKKGAARRMNYDPLVDAEAWEVTDLRVNVRSFTSTTAIGVVSFLNFGDTRMVNVELQKTKAGWRVDDIQVPDGRLRQLFEGPDPVPDAPVASAAPAAPVESRASATGPAPAPAPAPVPVPVPAP